MPEFLAYNVLVLITFNSAITQSNIGQVLYGSEKTKIIQGHFINVFSHWKIVKETIFPLSLHDLYCYILIPKMSEIIFYSHFEDVLKRPGDTTVLVFISF